MIGRKEKGMFKKWKVDQGLAGKEKEVKEKTNLFMETINSQN